MWEENVLAPDRALISIVIPVYNEERGLAALVSRLRQVMDKGQDSYEMIFVDDGSSDGSLALLRNLRRTCPNLTIVSLSRNFGKEVAMTAGLAHSRGDAVVVIDADLQDPPEMIPVLIAEWRNGYEMVYAQRTKREGETWVKLATARLFYKVMRGISSVPVPENVGDFRLMSRRVVNTLLELPERHRFMKGLYAWVGYRQKAVPYTRKPRAAGTTKWNYWKLWNLAIEGFTSFTIAPLKLATYLGLTIALCAFVFGIVIVGRTLLYGEVVRGYPTLMTTVLMLGGVQLIVLGVIGEYLGRVFNEAKQRPLYLVDTVEWAQHDEASGLRIANSPGMRDLRLQSRG